MNLKIILSALFKYLPSPFQQNYYRVKLKVWSILHLPRQLLIENTNFKISGWKWQAAIPARIDTTRIAYDGRRRNLGRMYYEPIEVPQFNSLLIGKNIFLMLVQILAITAI